MFHYTAGQWLLFFYFYCFFGWCIESAYVSIKDRKLTNRGFMRGPFLPLYGSGGTMMLVVSMPFREMGIPWRIIFTYLAGCLGATVLEYVTGVVMEALFKVRYWDYSNQKFNIKGHVCLGTSLSWGFLTIVMTEFVHVHVERVVFAIPGRVLTAMTLVLTAAIFADFALAFKAAIDLRDVLLKMEQAKAEMVRIQERLDVIIAAASESVESHKNDFVRNVSDLKKGIDVRLEGIKTAILTKPGEFSDSVRNEIMELKEKYIISGENHDRLRSLKDFFQRGMIRSNPSMTSSVYKESLDELKEEVIGRKKDGS